MARHIAATEDYAVYANLRKKVEMLFAWTSAFSVSTAFGCEAHACARGHHLDQRLARW